MGKVLVGTFLLVAFTAAGCGGSSASASKSGNGEVSRAAQRVLDDAIKATKNARSVHVAGKLTDPDGNSLGLDLTLVKGQGAEGLVMVGRHKLQVVAIGTRVYLKTGPASWEQLSDKRALQGLANGEVVFGFFKGLIAAESGFINNGETTDNGEDVVDIHGTSTNAHVYVAARGKPYIVALVKNDPASAGSLVFSKWNKPVTLTPPG